MKNSDNDTDLHGPFQLQRRCERAEAPAWNPSLLSARAEIPAHSGPPWRLWFPACAMVVALGGLGLFMSQPSQVPSPRLSEALPPLLDAPSQALFASLQAHPAHAPSDFLLPAYLTLQMP